MIPKTRWPITFLTAVGLITLPLTLLYNRVIASTPLNFLTQLRADDGKAGDVFGKAVAIKGNYALIGSSYSDADEKTDNSGAAYLYNLGQQTLTKLLPDEEMAGNLFGYSVAVDGNYGLISSAYYDEKGTDSGLAYIFDLTTGQQIQKFSADDGMTGDVFGYSVEIKGQSALVGAPYSDSLALDSGSVYLFDVNSGKQLQKFVPDDLGAGDLFGYSIAMDGQYALIASPYQDNKDVESKAKGVDQGAVYLFDITTGQQIKKLIPDDGAAGDVFGYSLAIKGKYALISAVYSDAKGIDSGAVYLFDIESGQQIRKFTADDEDKADHFGHSVAFNEPYVMIGSAYNDEKGVDSGAVYLFDVNTGQQISKITADDSGAGNLFGFSVGMDGQYALIGSAYSDNEKKIDQGSVYLFDLSTSLQIEK